MRCERLAAKCLRCGERYEPDHHLLLCPRCGSTDGELLGEPMLRVDEIVVG
jgi:hydrogenase nickel incorporation protein HypA/HybF